MLKIQLLNEVQITFLGVAMGKQQIQGSSNDEVFTTVKRTLASEYKLRLLLEEATAWSLSVGALSIIYPTQVLAKEGFNLLKTENNQSCSKLIDSFVRGSLEIHNVSFESPPNHRRHSWSLTIGFLDPNYNFEALGMTFQEIGTFKLEFTQTPLSNLVTTQIEEIVSRLWQDTTTNDRGIQLRLLAFEEINIPKCFFCTRELNIRNGSIAFFDNSQDGNIFKSMVQICHHACIPEGTHHLINLDRLASKNDVLYWTAEYFGEPWFLDSNWMDLVNSMFDVQNPDRDDNF